LTNVKGKQLAVGDYYTVIGGTAESGSMLKV